VTTIAKVSGMGVDEISHCNDRSFLWKKYTTGADIGGWGKFD
jgi:hypothetical protein